MTEIEDLIQQLELIPHPEGGYFRETYRSEGNIAKNALPDIFKGNRNFSTCIYFLLTSDTFSAFHKINQDEIWHFYQGSPIKLHTISESGEHTEYTIGNDMTKDQTPQLVVPAHHWFAAKVVEPNSYALVGCTVAPGFDFNDFVLAKREELTKMFPKHKKIITRFTRA